MANLNYLDPELELNATAPSMPMLAPPPSPPPAVQQILTATRPQPDAAARYEALKAQAPLSWWEKLVNPTGAAEAYANKVQHFAANEAGIDNQRMLRQQQQAVTEANLFKAIQATPPGARRKPYVGILQRLWQAQGIQADPSILETLQRSEADELEGLRYEVEQMLKENPQVDPTELKKFSIGDPHGAAEILSRYAARQQEAAKTELAKAQAGQKKAETQLLSGAFERLQGADSEPTAPSQPQATPGTPLLPQRAPGGSQGPSLRPASLDTPEGQQLQQFVVNRAKALGIDPAYAQALIHQESGWDPNAVSPTNVTGLAQVTNATGGRYGQTPATRTNPFVSANAGLSYLADLQQQSGGDIRKALARYNGGSDPQYVQNVEKHLSLYGGLPRPHSEAVGGASAQERATIQYYDREINSLQRKMDALAPAAMTPAGKGVLERFDTKLKTLMAERERIEKRYEGQPTARLRETAERLFPGIPYVMLNAEQRQAVATAAPELEAQDKATEAEATAKATQPYKMALAEASREGQTVKDVNEFRDKEGNPAPVGLTIGELKDKGYKQVKTLKDDQDDAMGNRLELITNLQTLADNYGTITTGPVEGRVERLKQTFGVSVKDEKTAQRLILEKIKNDKAFTVGGKTLTANEIARVQAELPQDTDAPEVFRAKLNTALTLATRYHARKVKALEEQGFFVPPTYKVGEARPVGGAVPGAAASSQAPAVSPALQEALDILNGKK